MQADVDILGTLMLQPPFDPIRIAAGGALLMILAAGLYARSPSLPRWARWTLGGGRLAVIAALTTLLLGPSAIREWSEANYRRKLVIAVDTSCSFGTRDVDDESRFEAARRIWLEPAFINRLRERFDLRLYQYDERPSPTGPGALWELAAPAGRRTRIVDAVHRLLDTEFAHTGRPVGILLVGDGHETDAGDPVAAGHAAAQRGVPIWTSCFGSRRPRHDLALVTSSGLENLFTGQTGTIAAKLVQTGFATREARVTLLREGTPVQELPVALGERTVHDVAFNIREDRPGLYEYGVRVEPLSEETDTENNARSVFVRVTNERIKVLLAEGRPYWDTKFLAHTLRTDPQVELTQIVQYGLGRSQVIRSKSPERPAASAPGSAPAPDANIDERSFTEPPVPRTRDDFFRYDVLIFGKDITRFLPPERLAILKEFLDQRGGGIVFARGRSYDPGTPEGDAAAGLLAPLEPAVWGEGYVQDLRLQLTPEGSRHPSFRFAAGARPGVVLTELPGLVGAVRIQREKAAALILARSAGKETADAPFAAIAYQNYGKGRVVSVLNEGLWRWEMLRPDAGSSTAISPFDEFWRGMLRWLATGADFLPGQEVALTVTRFPESLGDTAQIEVRLKYPPQAATPATLTAVAPDGEEQPLALDRGNEPAGLLRASFEPKKPGVHRLRLSTPDMKPAEQETRFCVYDYTVELIDTSADPAAMREIAEASGGAYIDPPDPQRFLSLLDAAHSTDQTRRDVEPAWDRPWILAAILAALCAEWFLRRRCGLA